MKAAEQVRADRLLLGQIACVVAACVAAKPPRAFVWPAQVFRETRGDAAESAARLIAAYIAREEFKLTQTRIGAALGRHRSTIGHARDVVAEWAARDDTDGAVNWLMEVCALCRRAVAIGQAQVDFEAAMEAA